MLDSVAKYKGLAADNFPNEENLEFAGLAYYEAFGYVTDDNKNLVADYPILPSTRKFWKKVLNAIDTVY